MDSTFQYIIVKSFTRNKTRAGITNIYPNVSLLVDALCFLIRRSFMKNDGVNLRRIIRPPKSIVLIVV